MQRRPLQPTASHDPQWASPRTAPVQPAGKPLAVEAHGSGIAGSGSDGSGNEGNGSDGSGSHPPGQRKQQRRKLHPGRSAAPTTYVLLRDTVVDTRVTARIVQQLAGGSVTSICLWSCTVSAAALAEILAATSGNRGLTELDLSGCQLDVAHCEHIAVLLRGTAGAAASLTQLRLSCCGLTDAALAAMLLPLLKNHRLARLDLTLNGVTERGMAALVACLSSNVSLREVRQRPQPPGRGWHLLNRGCHCWAVVGTIR